MLGVLGGSFNPPHHGHLALARTALEQLGLERVLLVPARMAPHKRELPDPGPEQRLQMCRLACQDDPRIEVSTLELERPGPSYTVDTLRLIRASDPSVPLTLILGADMARTLPTWREPREIVRLAALAVAERDRSGQRAVLQALEPLSEDARVSFLEMDPVAASSSQVRAMVASGQDVRELVCERVATHIARYGLYSQGVPSADSPFPGAPSRPS